MSEAVQVIREGGVIAYPTEAVWGLGCDPFNEAAVMRILALKQRPIEKGMIMVTGCLGQVASWIDPLSSSQKKALESSWPGPVTWLLPDSNHLPRWIKGDHDKVALRVSDHPMIIALTRQFGGPIISTSANPASLAPARTEQEVRAYFPDLLDGILPGDLGGLKTPTRIMDIETGQTLRD